MNNVPHGTIGKQMNRRQFLGLLIRTSAAIAIAPALKMVSPYERIEKDIYGKIIYLDKPLLLENINGITISNCHFIKTTNFDGPMLNAKNCNRLIITNCRFDDSTYSSNQPAIFFKS